MKPNRGLGKGLSALFSETEEDYGKSLIFEEEPEDLKAGTLVQFLPIPISREKYLTKRR